MASRCEPQTRAVLETTIVRSNNKVTDAVLATASPATFGPAGSEKDLAIELGRAQHRRGISVAMILP